MRKLLAAILVLLTSPAAAQEIFLPETMSVPVGKLSSAVIKASDAKSLSWIVTPSASADFFREYDPDPLLIRLRFIAYKDGQFSLVVAACKGDSVKQAVCLITAGTPGPGPKPPLPPDPIPDPISDVPIPYPGFRVLVVYETADLTKMPAAQQNVLFTKVVRDYLNEKCIAGADGKTKEWRMWDKDVATQGETKLWQDAMKRSRKSIPWIVISTGKTGYEGPLPADVPAAMELLKKFGG